METQDLDKFQGFDIKIEYEKICDEWAEVCCENIKANSPVEQHSSRGGKYQQGWTVKGEYDGEDKYEVRVWNATDWQLTHLLENGHLITNARNGTGWAKAHPHINPAFKSVRNKFVKAIKNAELKINKK